MIWTHLYLVLKSVEGLKAYGLYGDGNNAPTFGGNYNYDIHIFNTSNVSKGSYFDSEKLHDLFELDENG